MGSTIKPEKFQDFMDRLDKPVSVIRPPHLTMGGTPGTNMLECTGIKFMGDLVQQKRVHIQVLLGAELYIHLEGRMELFDLTFEMDVLSWQRPD